MFWQLRQSVRDKTSLTNDEQSFVYRAAMGRVDQCKTAMTDMTFRVCQFNAVIALDDEDTPFLLFHLRMCLPSPFGRDQTLFATPWRLLANVKLDGTPVENINTRDRQGTPIYHMPILLLGEADEEDDEGCIPGAVTGDVRQQDWANESEAGEGSGKHALVRSIRVLRFHVAPRTARDGHALNADGTASAWVTPPPYVGEAYLPHQMFEFSTHGMLQLGYAIGYVCLAVLHVVLMSPARARKGHCLRGRGTRRTLACSRCTTRTHLPAASARPRAARSIEACRRWCSARHLPCAAAYHGAHSDAALFHMQGLSGY